MDEDGHPPELLLHLVNTGVRIHLENLEWIEIPIGVSWLGKSLYLSCWGEVLISLLYLQYNVTTVRKWTVNIPLSSPLLVLYKMNQNPLALLGNSRPFLFLNKYFVSSVTRPKQREIMIFSTLQMILKWSFSYGLCVMPGVFYTVSRLTLQKYYSTY